MNFGVSPVRRARPVDGIGEELRYLIYFFNFNPAALPFK